jgi:Flp pilus assembly protein TadB
VLIIVLGAMAIVARAPFGLLGVVGLAIKWPVVFLVVAAAWSIAARRVLSRRTGPEEEASFLRALAAELASGTSLRKALPEAASRAPELDLKSAVRRAAVGLPAEKIGEALGSALRVNGRTTAAAFRLADVTGGRINPMMLTLAGRADEVGRLARERHALTAQVRASAWLVGGAPVGLLVVMGLLGVGPDLSGLGGIGRALMLSGLGMIGLGAAIVWWMVRRS